MGRNNNRLNSHITQHVLDASVDKCIHRGRRLTRSILGATLVQLDRTDRADQWILIRCRAIH